MKRIISLILCFCMVFSIMPINVFATTTQPLLTVSCPAEVTSGESFKVKVDLSDTEPYTALRFSLKYDNTKFEVVSAKKGSSFPLSTQINSADGPDKVSLAVASGNTLSTTGTVIEIEFKALSTASGTAEFTLENVSMGDATGEPVSVKTVNSEVNIKTAAFEITFDDTEYISEDMITVDISLVDGVAFASFGFALVYDSDKLEVESAAYDSMFEGAAQVNKNYSENKIKMDFSLASNLDFSGKVLTATFKVKNNVSGEAKFSFANQYFADENDNDVALALDEKAINITCTHKGVEWEETKTPDCKDPGLKEYECACGYYDSEELPKGDHNHQPTVFSPTKEDQGYTLYKCTGCGDEYKDNYVDALGYDVVFDANGGEFDVEKQNKRPDADLTITSKTPTKTGHTFKGWATDDNVTTVEYAAGSKYSANEDVTLYAVWEINKYKLTYKVDGDIYKEFDVEYDSVVTAEANPTKTGHTFSGWSAIPTKMPANDVVITGTFAANKHDIIYKVDGNEYKRATLGYGTTITPEPFPAKEGHTFSGWSSIPVTMPDEDVVITGTFSVNSYKLVYKVDGEEHSSENVPYGTALAPKEAPTKEGHTFSGWSTVPATMPAENVTITGSFSANTYKVFYKVDGADYKSVNVVFGTTIPAEANPTKTGYTFSGWSSVPTTMPANNVTITGTFTINKHDVIYKVDGTEYDRVELAYGSAITPIAAPTKTGYTFSGWSTAPATMPDNDVTITGTFAVNKHDVIYKVDGTEYDRVELAYGSAITPIAAPTKTGYTFSGWSTAPATMPDNDVTITGAFSVNSYKLIYKVDGEQYSIENIAYGTTLTPKTAPTKEGHTFSGWSTVPSTMPANDVTITGTFSINSYKLIYKVDGAEYSSEDVVYGTAIVPKVEPTKEGYTFSGWSLIPATMPANDVVITGKFSLGNYKLVYKVDGEVYKTIAYGFDADVIPEDAPVKEGYSFSGWSTIPSKMPANDVTVTGTFSINSYKLVYKLDGEQYSSEDVVYGTALTPKTAPTKEGHTFSGWSTVPATMPANDVTITGSFSVNTYKVFYKVDNEEYKSVDVVYRTAIPTETAPTKEGHTFSGWSEAPTTMPAENVTITGSFTLNKYKLVYKVDGNEYSSEDVAYGTTIVAKEAPTK